MKLFYVRKFEVFAKNLTFDNIASDGNRVHVLDEDGIPPASSLAKFLTRFAVEATDLEITVVDDYEGFRETS